jgi:DNA-3-methyladenine glycosylase
MKRETVRSPRFVKLRRSFYVRPTLAVARDLLGVYLLRRVGPRTLIGRIVEVEAYRGSDDPASHAYRGRTKRNEVMFFKGGYLYVYFTYGMHYCANVVTGKSGTGSATLIRAVEPVGSVETLVNNRMRGRRGRSTPRSRRHASKPLERHQLCSGPARVCEAFALTGKDNGKDLCGSEIWLARRGRSRQNVRVGRSPRVGVTQGMERRWRFYIAGSPSVSRAKPGARAQ